MFSSIDKDKDQPYIPLAAVKDNQMHKTLNNQTAKEVTAQFRDVVTSWSTIEGYVSLRNHRRGSQFIQRLDKQLKDFGGKQLRDLYEAHIAVTQDLAIDSGAFQVEFNIDGTPKYYWMNQTPLYKSSATRKVGFKRLSDEERKKIKPNHIDISAVLPSDKTYNTLVKNLESLKVLYECTMK
jgi:hypothetical protein